MKLLARLFLLLFLVILASCQKDPLEIPDPWLFDVEIGNSKIPYLVIDTKGTEIRNEPKVSAEMKIFIEKAEMQQAGIGIEYRGSTSFRLSDKKSYGIETWDVDGNDMDVTFFDFPEEEDFVLMGHIVNLEQGYTWDRTLMYHYFGYQLFGRMGRYTSKTKFVELEINGNYMGIYVFMEKLKRDRNRIDINTLGPDQNDPESITGGYILKIDKTAGGDLNIDQPLEYFESNWSDDATYTSDISFRSNYDINGELLDFEPFGPPYHADQYLETYFLYEYPKAGNISAAQKEYIQSYIHNFETALLTDDFSTQGRTYTDYIDLASFVDFFILNEVCRNVDGYRLSTYLFKDRGGKLNMGPVWDLNIGYDSGDRVPEDDWVINYNQFVDRDAWMMPFWWPRLLEDPLFRAAVKERWNELRAGTMSTVELLNMVEQASVYLQENGAIQRNFTLWGVGMGIDYNSAIGNLKAYLEERTAWMDGEIGSF